MTDNATIRDAKRQIYQEFRVATAGRVKSFLRGAARIVAEVMTRQITTGLNPRDEPAVQDVPVLFPGGGGYGFFFDMREGDPAAIVCADGPVRGYFETGEAVTPGPGSTGHDYGSAMAIPGGRISATDNPTAPPNAEGEGLVGAVDGSASVIFRGAGLSSRASRGRWWSRRPRSNWGATRQSSAWCASATLWPLTRRGPRSPLLSRASSTASPRARSSSPARSRSGKRVRRRPT